MYVCMFLGLPDPHPDQLVRGHGSEDPDLYQNVTDPQHWHHERNKNNFEPCKWYSTVLHRNLLWYGTVLSL
jgi:hypothetical protein